MQIEGVSSQKRSGTVLFADVVGFTSLAEGMGEEAAFEMIRDVSARMQAAIHAYHGTVGEFRGDGIMALFSVTAGLEDGPLRACQAALQITQEIASVAPEMQQLYGVAPAVRVGLHCGSLVVGDVGGKTKAHVAIIGDAANVASRLEGLAKAGQVLISQDLFALVEGQVEVDDLGEQVMRGKARPLHIYQLNQVRDGVSRFDASRARGLSTLVDREAEIAALAEVFTHARRGQIAAADIQGEPGIGKSRLLHEFKQSLLLDEISVLKGDCRADGSNVPFLPFADLLRAVIGIDTRTDRATTQTKITDLLTQLQVDTKAVLPYLIALLGKAKDTDIPLGETPDMVGARLRQVIIDLITHACGRGPVVLIIEDLHWADTGTVQIIDRLIRLQRDMPLMVLTTYRPSFTPPWARHARVHHIIPRPISEGAVNALIREVMADAGQADHIAAIAAEKAEGNPLYAEEIARFLMQQPQAQGVTPRAIALPTNLQNMIMERFDKLGAQCRALLQGASAIGRQFEGQLAHQITDGQGAFKDAMLAQAVKADLIRHTGSGYEFKHALVQDAIYDTLMRTARLRLHAQIAADLEDRYGTRTQEAADPLAYHFDQAEMPAKAAPYLITAGLRNLSLFSLDAAETSFSRAFELMDGQALDPGPEMTAGLFAGWFEVKQWRAEFGRILKLYESQAPRMAQIREEPQYTRILGLVGVAYTQNLQYEQAQNTLNEAIAIGERTQDVNAIAYGCLGLMGLNCQRPQQGFWERNQELAARVNGLLGDAPQPYFRTYCNFYVNWSHSIRGDIDLALANGHDLFALGRELNFSGAVGFGAICVAFNEAYCENYETAIEYASAGAAEAGGVVDRMVSLGLKGLSMVLNGDVDGGARILNDIFEQREALEYRGIENIVDGPIGLARAMGGDMGGGVAWIKDAIGRAQDNGNAHGAAMSHISLGTLYLLLATGAEKPSLKMLANNAMFLLREAPFAKSRAISHFEAAIEMARDLQMYGVMAQALHGKGMAQKAARKTAKARATLLEAREAVAQIKWRMMHDRIEAEVAALG